MLVMPVMMDEMRNGYAGMDVCVQSVSYEGTIYKDIVAPVR